MTPEKDIHRRLMLLLESRPRLQIEHCEQVNYKTNTKQHATNAPIVWVDAVLSEKLQSINMTERLETMVSPVKVEDLPKNELELDKCGKMTTDMEPPYTWSSASSREQLLSAKIGSHKCAVRITCRKRQSTYPASLIRNTSHETMSACGNKHYQTYETKHDY